MSSSSSARAARSRSSPAAGTSRASPRSTSTARRSSSRSTSTRPSPRASACSPRSTRSSRPFPKAIELRRLLVTHHADPIGHLVGLLSLAWPRRRDGCFLYVSDRGLANLILTRRGFGAITFGHVIVSNVQPTPALWRHELRHVAQYERLGFAFLPLYLWYPAKYGCGDHPLERDASEDRRPFSYRRRTTSRSSAAAL